MFDISEKDIIKGLIKGDMSSFRQLFDKKYTLFHSFTMGMVKDSWLAEDITQNIFLKVWLNREKLDPNKSIQNYLYVLAKNEIRDHFRLKVNMHTEEIQENQRIQTEDFEGTLDMETMRAQISKIVAHMPEQRRKIFTLSREQMLSNNEIAEQMHLSIRTVEKHISLALKDIRKHLSSFHHFLFLFY